MPLQLLWAEKKHKMKSTKHAVRSGKESEQLALEARLMEEKLARLKKEIAQDEANRKQVKYELLQQQLTYMLLKIDSSRSSTIHCTYLNAPPADRVFGEVHKKLGKRVRLHRHHLRSTAQAQQGYEPSQDVLVI